ncbi:MAG: recombinase family protein [Defluviitaleaceae bacterium]|nr:recombinase family protein [Defluviitaleaceae bacterium]
MIGKIYALIRVSTNKQKEKRQVIRMLELGVAKENIIVEKESGRSPARTKYKRLVKRLKAGDILYIENIDRLSRDYDGIISEWSKLTVQKGVIIKVLDTPLLDTDQANNDLMNKFLQNIILHVQAFQAENEWEKTKYRQAQGIAVAKASGMKLGRPKKERTDIEIKTAKQYLKREIDLDTALAMLGLKKSAFYNLCRVVNEPNK